MSTIYVSITHSLVGRIVILLSLFTLLGLLLGSQVGLAQAPSIRWQKALGGSGDDQAYAITASRDGGYVVAGVTRSNNGDVSGFHGFADSWVVKLDAAGNIAWQKALGGSDDDQASSITASGDGGYVVAGYTFSNDGDVTGNHGSSDYWVVKLDAAGNILWQKTLGGTRPDYANSITASGDGGYVVVGETQSNDGDVSGFHGFADSWVVKLDAAGNILWQKTLGGSGTDVAFDITASGDGGFVVAGVTQSNNGDVTGNHGDYDSWVVKLDAAGNIAWQKLLGGSYYDQASSITASGDGGYVVAGSTESNNGDASGNHGFADSWVVKLNATGNILWQKTLGGLGFERTRAITASGDGGYVVAGYTQSNDGDVSGNHGGDDSWVVKLGSAAPTVSNLAATSGTVCAGRVATFTATVGNVSGSYSYTLTNGSIGAPASVSVTGTATTTSFSQTLVVNGSGSQSFSLVVSDNGSSGLATTSLTVGTHPDLQAMTDFFNSTNGSDWTNKTGWLTSCNPCSGWYGVTCSGGRVSRISLTENHLTGSIPSSLSALTNLNFLSLYANWLSGSIPSSLGSLTNLTYLNLGYNIMLSGSIPASLGSLTNLRYLDLGTNQLSGSIPESLSALTNLTELSLDDNKLSGCYPASLTALCGVTTKNFTNNAGLPGGGSAAAFNAFCSTGRGSDAFVATATASSLTGNVGTIVSLSTTGGSSYSWLAPAGASLTSSASSSVVSASLTATGVQTFTVVVSNGGTCSQTATVSVTATAVLPTISGFVATSGTVCAGSMATFTATIGNVTGSYSYTLTNGSLGAPASVSVTGTATTTSFSQTLVVNGSGSQSFSLVVSDNGSSGLATTNLTVGTHPDYQPLVDLYNSTNGSGWTNKTGWLTSCNPCGGWYGVTCSGGRVNRINLISNQLSGSIPSSLSALTNLIDVRVSNNQLSGSIPSSLGSLANLAYLDLSGNELSGSIPSSLSALTNLATLRLSGNQLSGSIPANLSALTNLTILEFNNNELSGDIPSSFSTLTNLTFLQLSTNQLSGSIPASLSALTKLAELYLFGNQLSGSIPPGLSALTNLTNLNLADNQLSGSIPASLSALTKLTSLRLYTNQLSGSIPASLSALTNLTTLWLSGNQLSGSIPASLSALTNLTQLLINDNQLSGCYPASLTALCGISIKNFTNNTGLPGGGSAAAFNAFCSTGRGSDAFVATATASSLTGSVGTIISLSTAGGSSYSWLTPAGATLTTSASSSVVSASLTATGVQTFTVVVSNGGTCSQTATVSVTVTAALPTLTGFAATSGTVCAGSMATFTATVGNVTSNYAYTLLVSNHTAISGTETSATFSRNLLTQISGNQSSTLIVTANGQSTSAVTTLTINAAPTATLTNNGPLSCTFTSVTLTASGGNSYTFVTPNGTVLGTSGPTTIRSVNTPGTYSVTVGNSNGCVSTTSTTVTSNTATVTVTNPSITTATQNTTFSQTFTALGGATPRSFTLASGTLPTGLKLSAAGVLSGTPTQSGSFSITVRAIDANGCTGTGATYTLVVNSSVPTISGFTTLVNTVCVRNPITFTATIGNVTGSYAYTITNGSSMSITGSTATTLLSQSLTPDGSGSQSFSLIVSTNSLSTWATTNVTVNSLPTATLTNNGPLSCTLTTVTLTASGGNSYTFANGNGTVLPSSGNTLPVTAAGTYSVTVASASGCMSTTTTTVLSSTGMVSVSNPTTTTATLNSAFNQSFTATGGTGNYSFSIASGSLPTGLSLSTSGVLSGTPTQSGTFMITVQAKDASGCSGVGATYTLLVNAVPPTISGFTALPTTVCVGTPITFTATVGNVTGSYTYTLANGSILQTGTTSGNFSQSVATSGTGGQSFTLTVSSNSQFATATTTVTVNSLPVATLTANFGGTLTCAQTSLTLTASGGTSFIFAGPGILSQNADAGTAIVNVNGTYSVTVTTSGCSSTTSLTVYQDSNVPTVSISPSNATLSCATPSVVLSAVGSGTYRWSTGATSQTITATSAAIYSVTLTAQNGCTSTGSANVIYQNCAPTLANAISNLTATVGTSFSYTIPANTFTDAETPNSLTLSVSGLPAGLSFVSPNIITGTPSTTVGSPFTVTVVATDAGGLSANTSFSLTVPPPTFAIAGVNMLDCNHVSYFERRINFRVNFESTNGQPISLSVVNETRSITINEPYQLTVYTDNPVIVFKATQAGTPGEASFSYNWLAFCANGNPRVENPIPPQSATVGQAFSYAIPTNTFTDAETPNSLALSVAGLPAGLSLVAPNLISGTASASASAFYSVTVIASDPSGGTVATILPLSVVNLGGCQSMFTLKAGDWNDVSVWSCGRIPQLSDVVTLHHGVSLPPTYQGEALNVIYTTSGRLLFGASSRLRLGGTK